jgi:hypothetical protein
MRAARAIFWRTPCGAHQAIFILGLRPAKGIKGLMSVFVVLIWRNCGNHADRKF